MILTAKMLTFSLQIRTVIKGTVFGGKPMRSIGVIMLLITCCSSTAAVAAEVDPRESECTAATVFSNDLGLLPSVCVEQQVNFFLQKAMRARAVLLEQGMAGRASRLWGSATEFAAIIREDDPETMPGFLPMLDGLIRVLDESLISGHSLEMSGLDNVQSALDDQLEIFRNPGLFAEAEGMVTVTVRAQGAMGPALGYYVSMDLWPLLPQGRSAAPLSGITDKATGRVRPGKYFVRAYRPGQQQAEGCKIQVVGRNGKTETIDVLVDGGNCAR
jgi:hypothetical protein